MGITQFKERYPKIDVTLAEANSASLTEMMKNEQVDIVIDSFDTMPEIYQGEPLSIERILLCVLYHGYTFKIQKIL